MLFCLGFFQLFNFVSSRWERPWPVGAAPGGAGRGRRERPLLSRWGTAAPRRLGLAAPRSPGIALLLCPELPPGKKSAQVQPGGGTVCCSIIARKRGVLEHRSFNTPINILIKMHKLLLKYSQIVKCSR